MQKRKISIIGVDARKKIIAGANYLADAVKLTHGPYGKNFASGVHGGPIRISNDGVSLAKEIQGKDEYEDIGVRAVREAATKTNDKAGDGTTGAVILTQSILASFDLENLGIGKSVVALSKQVATESIEVVKRLTEMAVPVTTKEQLINIAKVSVEDQDLAELIGGAQWEVGASGSMMAEEHNDVSDVVEYVHGVRVDNGFAGSRLANNPEKQALDLKNVRILLTNKIFNTEKDITDLMPLFESLAKTESTTQLILMGRAFDQTAFGWCVSNLKSVMDGKSAMAVYPVNCPYIDMDELMEDIAATTGGRYINGGERNVVSATTKDVGTASKIFFTRGEGFITGSKPGDNERIDALVMARIDDIHAKLSGTITPFERRALETRLAQLTTGTAIVKVGAETEQERHYKKDKVDDAVNAVKAAMQEGVVAGGGMALMAVADAMPDAMISDALRAPYKQIMTNAGETFDIPEWVQDPLKVVRIGFEKASSIARSLATTEIVVNWENEKPMWPAQVNTAQDNEE